MRATRLGLSDNTRKTSVETLQALLVDTIDLRLAVKQAHWTVRGPRFQQLHELFDTFVAPLDAEVDSMAERIATLGALPDGRAQGVSASSRLDAYPEDAGDGNAHLTALADRFAALGNSVRSGIDVANDAGDADTADLLTGTSRFLDQTLWFLEAHLAEDAGS
ncbi:MAG: DNA starvation/stationary phase protection protein Dps [Pseudomonadota bacterium]